jgi:hypothetical protein
MRFEKLLPNLVVIAGLDPAIHSVTVAAFASATEWIPWSSHGMTTVRRRVKCFGAANV